MAKPCRRGCWYWKAWISVSGLSSRGGGCAPSVFPGLRRGTFHRRKVPKTRRGLRPPVPFGAVRRASPEKASPGLLRSTRPSRPILPAPSRLRAGQWNRIAVTATGRSSKAAPAAPERGGIKHTAAFARILPSHIVVARIARPPESDVSRMKRDCCSYSPKASRIRSFSAAYITGTTSMSAL